MSQNTLLSFPCTFHIKVVGKASLEFQGAVSQIVRQHVPDLGEGAIVENTSSQGNYLALTITIQAQSQAQLDAIYSALSADKRVLMVL